MPGGKQIVHKFTTLSNVTDVENFEHKGFAFLKALVEDPLSLIRDFLPDLLQRIQELVKQHELVMVKTTGATLSNTFPLPKNKIEEVFRPGNFPESQTLSFEDFILSCNVFDLAMKEEKEKSFSFKAISVDFLYKNKRCFSVALALRPKGKSSKLFSDTLHITLAATKNSYGAADAAWAMVGMLVKNACPGSLQDGVFVRSVTIDVTLESSELSVSLIPPPPSRKV